MNGWVDRWMNGCVDRWMNRWVDRWMNGWVDGRMGGQMDEWLNREGRMLLLATMWCDIGVYGRWFSWKKDVIRCM